LVFVTALHWRGSAHGFPLGGKLSQKTPKVNFVTDEGIICCIQSIFHISMAVPSSAPSGHLPPRGKVRGAVQI